MERHRSRSRSPGRSEGYRPYGDARGGAPHDDPRRYGRGPPRDSYDAMRGRPERLAPPVPGLSAGGMAVGLPPVAAGSGGSLPIGLPPQRHLEPHLDPSDKTNRELFVGNTPVGTTEHDLRAFLSAAMTKTGLAKGPGDPIATCRVNARFSFIELRSIEEATSARNLNGIPFMGQALNIGRPSKYRGPREAPVRWQLMLGLGDAPAPATDTSNKLYRELFFGNTPIGITSEDLRDFVIQSMRQVGLLAADEANPVVNTRASGKFAFVEFRTREICSAALNLNGIPFRNSSLKISRPSKYDGPFTPSTLWEETLANFLSSASAPAAAAPPSEAEGASRTIRIANMVTPEDVATEAAVAELQMDARDECSKYGDVEDVQVDGDLVVVTFRTQEMGKEAAKKLRTRTFDGKLVEVTFVAEPAPQAAQPAPARSSRWG